MQVKRFSFLLWGKPKIGKTILASQFPRPFFVDLDESTGSVIAMRANLGLSFDFDVIAIDEAETTDEDFIQLCGKGLAKESAWAKFKKLVDLLARRMPEDTTLILDNLSRAAEYLIAKIAREPGGHRPLQIQNWGMFTIEMQDILNSVKASGCKCNVIMIGHEEYQKDPTTDELERHLLCPTKMRFRVPSAVTDFLYMKTKVRGPVNKRETVRLLQSQPDQLTAVGSRALIPDIENPTYEKMRPYLEKALNRKLPDPTWTPPGKDA